MPHRDQPGDDAAGTTARSAQHPSTPAHSHSAVPADAASSGPGVGDQIGEAAGGISGVITGAALGSLGGPVGTVIGGIAGAVGGWWAGRAVSEAATQMTDGTDDAYYRARHDEFVREEAARAYDDARPAYHLGHLAGLNPDYGERYFEEVEVDLQRGWTGEVTARYGEWSAVRGYAREAYERSRTAAPADRPGVRAGRFPDGQDGAAPLDRGDERPGV